MEEKSRNPNELALINDLLENILNFDQTCEPMELPSSLDLAHMMDYFILPTHQEHAPF